MKWNLSKLLSQVTLITLQESDHYTKVHTIGSSVIESSLCLLAVKKECREQTVRHKDLEYAVRLCEFAAINGGSSASTWWPLNKPPYEYKNVYYAMGQLMPSNKLNLWTVWHWCQRLCKFGNQNEMYNSNGTQFDHLTVKV